MSAKRRQANLNRFTQPADEVSTVPEVPRSRRGRSARTSPGDGSSPFVVDDDDSDFIATVSDDDDFIDDEDDEGSIRTNNKGKAKAKSKGKAEARTSGRSSARTALDGSAFMDENPRVMLISLKAGALGLNLTVASNVYLMDRACLYFLISLSNLTNQSIMHSVVAGLLLAIRY
jgi:SWI/SNF-related matrix-associated actin-dependent regulator of chromatin subfamily A3